MALKKKQFIYSLTFFLFCSVASALTPVFYPEMKRAFAAWQKKVPQTYYYKVPVLLFHDLDGKGPYSVTRHEFRLYMQKIKAAGVQVMSLRDLHRHAVSRKLLERPSVVITIDDDYTNIVRVATPILREFSYPATLYVYIQDIQGRPESGMSWEDLNRIAAEGFDIQNHSFAHTRLNKPYRNESASRYANRIYKEIISSGDILKRHVPSFDRFSFAFPMGYYNKSLQERLKALGYKVLTTTDSIPLDLTKEFDGIIHRYTIQKHYVRDPEAMFQLQLSHALEPYATSSVNLSSPAPLIKSRAVKKPAATHKKQEKQRTKNRKTLLTNR